jgi:hypothetical protein
VPHLVLHAPRVSPGAPLELFCDVVLEVANHELRHLASRDVDDITISSSDFDGNWTVAASDSNSRRARR